MKNKKAFTLIEFMVVIAVIAILMSIITIKFLNVQKTSRDTQRKVDLRLIQNALEEYYANNKVYPSTCEPGAPNCSPVSALWFHPYGGVPGWGWYPVGENKWVPNLVPDYLLELPVEPKNGRYAYKSNGEDYALVDICGVERDISPVGSEFYVSQSEWGLDSNCPDNNYGIYTSSWMDWTL